MTLTIWKISIFLNIESREPAHIHVNGFCEIFADNETETFNPPPPKYCNGARILKSSKNDSESINSEGPLPPLKMATGSFGALFLELDAYLWAVEELSVTRVKWRWEDIRRLCHLNRETGGGVAKRLFYIVTPLIKWSVCSWNREFALPLKRQEWLGKSSRFGWAGSAVHGIGKGFPKYWRRGCSYGENFFS